MRDFLLIYAVMQLMSTAFGLTVIGIVKSLIEEKLQELYDTDYESKVLERLYSSKFKNMDELNIKKYLYTKGFTKE